MVLFECAGPIQPKPSYAKFGNFRRVMWLWFAVTHYSAGGINELLEGIARAAVSIHEEDKRKAPST